MANKLMLSFKGVHTVTGTVCMISFVLAIVFFVLFIMAGKVEFENTVIANEGLRQRLTLLFMYMPLAYTAIRNIKLG